MRPRRNPVCYVAGDSGSGKTTLCQFAIGAWSDPTHAPFRIEAGRTTRAGYLQTLEHLGGLPLFVDEAHTAAQDGKDLEALSYQFANGEAYTRGGADGKTRGGDQLGGTILLAGEALPGFQHAGAHRRVLWIDTSIWSPLGAPTQSSIGAERAAILEKAWTRGAGLFGKAVAEAIWQDWEAFTSEVKQLEQAAGLESLPAWRTPLAIAAAALSVACRVAEATDANPMLGLLGQWVKMLTTGQDTTDPATEAWERLLAMLAQVEERRDAASGWVQAYFGHELVACRQYHEAEWRVLTTSKSLEERVGKSVVQLHGSTWIRRGLITPAPDGKASAVKAMPGGKSARVLLVPIGNLSAKEEEA